MAAAGSLREALKSATRAQHDALDCLLAPLALGPRYATFLSVQLVARAPAERWLASHGASIAPPRQCHLIAADLAELGKRVAPIETAFLPADQREAWGAIWALAGSSLGNRALLQQRRKSGAEVANSFLADAAMPAFWNEFRPSIEREFDPETTAHAVRGAQRVFAAFLESHSTLLTRLAA